MATLKELRDERLRKLDELKQLGINPYPARLRNKRTHSVAGAVNNFDSFEGQTGTLVGRITTIRKFGKLAFIVIKGEHSETIQLLLKDGDVKPFNAEQQNIGLEYLQLLDAGDFV